MEFQLLLKSNNCDPDQSSSSSTQSNIVKLSKGFKTILGRGSNWGLLDVQLSRKHCCFFVSEDGKHLTLTHLGMNPCLIEQLSSKGKKILLEKNQSLQLYEGDMVYLLPPDKHAFQVTRSNIINLESPKIKEFNSNEKENLNNIAPSETANPHQHKGFIVTPSNLPSKKRQIEDFFSVNKKSKSEGSMVQEFSSHRQSLNQTTKLPSFPIKFFQPKTLKTTPFQEEIEVEIKEELSSVESHFSSETSSSSSQLKNSNSTFIESPTPAPFLYCTNSIPSLKELNSPNSVSFGSLFSPKIKKIFLTTYKLEVKWLLKQHGIFTRVPVVIVHGQQNVTEKLPLSITLYKPSLPVSYGVHHGKLGILYFQDKIRIIISTANLLQKDYERKVNSIWWEDFPVKDNGRNSSQNGVEFEETLKDYLKHLKVPYDFNLSFYDFSKVSVKLVTSVPGVHSASNLYKYGHMKLRKILSDQTVSLDSSFHSSSYILSQCSSIGSFSEKWLKDEWLESCLGNNTRSEKNEKTSSQTSHILQIVWPNHDFVLNCIDGISAGYSLCFPEKNFKSFFKSYLYTYQSKDEARATIPPHIKSYCRYNEGKSYWYCLSSANLSCSAWGQLQKNNSQFAIRNYEIGLVFLPKEKNSYFSLEEINLPYLIPPKPYDWAKEKPWTSNELDE